MRFNILPVSTAARLKYHRTAVVSLHSTLRTYLYQWEVESVGILSGDITKTGSTRRYRGLCIAWTHGCPLNGLGFQTICRPITLMLYYLFVCESFQTICTLNLLG
jgi:hypothetical protein